MADTIEISAIAEVIDKASGPLKAIKGVIDNVTGGAKDTAGFFSNMGDQIKGAFGGIGGMLGDAGSAIGGFASQLTQLAGPLSGLTGLAGLGGMTAAVTSFINTARDISTTATQIGITTDALQQFRYAAGNADRADTALQRLRKTLVDVGKEGKATKDTADLFDKLGISMQQIKEGKIEQILPQIIKGFEGITDPQQRANAGMAIFGKQWLEVSPLILKGTAGLEEGAQKFDKFGKSVQTLKEAGEAGRAMKELGESVAAARDTFASALLPVFTPMLKWLADFVENNQELLKQVALPAFIAALTAAIIPLGVAVATALGPWGLLAAAIAAAAVAIYENWGPIKEWISNTFGPIFEPIEKAYKLLEGFVSKSFNEIKTGWQEGGLIGAAEAYFNVVFGFWKDLGTKVVEVFKNIDWSGLATSVGDWFKNINWEAVGQWVGKALGEAIMLPFKAGFAIGEWLTSLDWASIGNTVGTLLWEAIKLPFTITTWVAQWGQALGEGAAQINWTGVVNAINSFFGNLVLDFVEIGKKLLKGLIDGMLASLPSLSSITEGIKAKFSGISLPSWLGGGGGGGGGEAPALPTAAAANENTRPGLLERAGAAISGRVRNDVNVRYTGPLEVTATQSASGASVQGDTNVGRSTMTQAAG